VGERPYMMLRMPSDSFKKILHAVYGRLSQKSGNVLVFIVVIMIVFGLLGVTMLSLFSTSTGSSATANESRRAFYMSESGIRYAMSELRNGNFSAALINNTLNSTIYTVNPSGKFSLKIFSAGFKSVAGATIGSSGGDIILKTKVGRIPNDYSIPKNSTVSIVNSAYTGIKYQNSPVTNSPITDFAWVDDNSIRLHLSDDFKVGTGNSEIVCFAVHPSSVNPATIPVGQSVYVDPAASKVFPKYNGAVKIQGSTYLYKERIDHLPTNVELRSLNHTVPISNLVTDDFVLLDSGNYYIISAGTSGDVTFGGGMDHAVSVYQHPVDEADVSGITSSTFNPVVDTAHGKQDFMHFDDSQKSLTIGNVGGTFGGAWYKDTRSVGGTDFCVNGSCQFGLGVRAFFVLGYSGTGDGLTFSLISAGPNPLDGNSPNNTASSVGGDFELSELLGYAGDSRIDTTPNYLDGTGNGLRPPKLAAEFDGRTNNQNTTYCSDATHVNQNTRFDPDLPAGIRDHVQYVFWGSRSPITAPCRANKSSYDDNRHDVKSPIAEQQWPFDTGTRVRPKPAVSQSDGTIYVGSGSGSNGDGRVFAIKPDGTQKWVFNSSAGGDNEFRSSPALDLNGHIYIGSNDNYLYSFNPTTNPPTVPEPPLYRWRTLLLGQVKSGPAVDEARNRVYVGSDNKFYAINKGNGNIIWKYPPDEVTYVQFVSSPIIDPLDGTIYVGSVDNGHLYAFNPDGTVKWQYPSSGSIGAVETSPRINPVDGNIYFGSNDTVYAINRSGVFQWSRSTNDNYVVTTPAVTPDGLTIYVGSDNGHLYARNCNSNGTIKWKFPPDATVIGAVKSSPAIDFDGTIYFGTDSGKLYAVNPDGTLKWTFPASGSVGDIRSSPTIGLNGIIYVGSDDGKVYAIDPFVDPRNMRNLYLTATELGVTPSDNWFNSGPWAVRMEIERATDLNGNGNYDYTLRTWMRKCGQPGCTDILGTFFDDTRIKYDYSAIGTLPLAQTVELAPADHTPIFDTFLFGFTSAKATGDDQSITINNFKLSFIRPADPPITSDSAWPPP
jgi:outer membrane protein assembly factor BamB